MTLPTGFRIRLSDGTSIVGDGQVLIGGSPLTMIRLTPAAASLVRDGSLAVSDPATAALGERLLATNLGQPDLAGVDSPAATDLTVILPVRDRVDQLDRALAALSPARCLVVDDASEHPDLVAGVAHRHGAEVVPLVENLGPAGARNAGLARVTTPYVAFVDCDVQVRLADLLALTRHFEDPSVCLVAPRIEGVSTSPRPRWFERYETTGSSLTLGKVPASVRPGAAVAWLPSACLVARTEALGDGFDAALRIGEDVDLVWRLVDRGLRVRYDPSVTAGHETRSTMRRWLGRKFVYGAGGAGLAARHGNRLAPAVLTPTYALAAATALVRSAWAVPACAVSVTVGARAVQRALPQTPERNRLAMRIAGRGLGWAIRQESSLAVRHWWPLAILGASVSRRMRRGLATALIVDSVVALTEHRSAGAESHPLAILLGRRLDDAAYGSGLWWGALRARSIRVLLPRRP